MREYEDKAIEMHKKAKTDNAVSTGADVVGECKPKKTK